MGTEELKNTIQLYFDGELEKSKEPSLFSMLSLDAEARDYFKSLNLLKNTAEETGVEFPQELEEKIFYSLKNKKSGSAVRNTGKNTIGRIFSYSAAVILIVINIYLLGRLSSYNDKMNAVETVVQKQTRIIELLYNSLPAAEINAKWEKEIIIKADL